MIEVETALSLAVEAGRSLAPLPTERVAVLEASGRVLAETVTSASDVPAQDYSAMDGYALHSLDLSAGVESLPVVGTCQTGHPIPALRRGTCLRIFTGAPIPDGADTVVMQENTARQDDLVRFVVPVRTGVNIRRAGEDLKKGDAVLTPGRRLTPFDLGLLSTVERTEVTVYCRPRVAIVCTGDELRAPGSSMFGGQLAESNSPVLAALVQTLGGQPERTPLVKDELSGMKQALGVACSRADLVLSVGGVSVGEHDWVRPALEEQGAHILFHNVKIKPGKPALLARYGRCVVLGLPGNPSSAQVVFSVLGAPLLRALAGRQDPHTSLRRAVLDAPFRQKPGRKGYYRAILRGDSVEILPNQASGASTSSAWANCLAILEDQQTEVPRGTEVAVLSYADLL